MSEVILVGDVGGTNCRLALFDGELGPVRTTKTADHSSLQDAIDEFIGVSGAEFDRISVAVAGPVDGSVSRLTNVDWTVDGSQLRWPATVLNDLEAAAIGVMTLGPDATRVLRASCGSGAVIVAGVGTGFGAATIDGGCVRAFEPGHDPFPGPIHPLLADDPGSSPSVEYWVSGPGFARMKLALKTDDVRTHERVFLWMLARAIGALATEQGAGKIILMGGMVQMLPGAEVEAALTGAATLAADVGIEVVVHPYPALVGAAHAGRGFSVHK